MNLTSILVPLIPCISLVGGILTLIYHFRKENTNLLSNVFSLLSCLIALYLLKFINHPLYYITPLFNLEHKYLINLSLRVDNLSIFMLILINFISLILHRYATSYLRSDTTQGRFMAQMSILTAAVSFFAISGNLFTAFIAWQFIGLTLYILINHYHYDLNANRSAKKNFIINRIGDFCFLLAVVLCYQHFGSSDFTYLNTHYITIENLISLNHHTQMFTTNVLPVLTNYSLSINNVIVILVFIAVMTKSAQFPFHIWLPDTMEAPTPVSAMMHAGVINAGGFLLTRISGFIPDNGLSSNIIFSVGATTILVANFCNLTQSDVKKQLAYSTMGQMGFMLIQCSIGMYFAAIFHLITHGLLKGFLFLNAGNSLSAAKAQHKLDNINTKSSSNVMAIVISIVLIAITYLIQSSNNHINNHDPYTIITSSSFITMLFISITIAQALSQINKTTKLMNKVQQLQSKLITLGILIILIGAYYYLEHTAKLTLTQNLLSSELLGNKQLDINNLPQNNFKTSSINNYKLIICLFLFLIQFLSWSGVSIIIRNNNKLSIQIYRLSSNKLFIENLYRKTLLNPYRKIGDLINYLFTKTCSGKILGGLIILITISSTIYGWIRLASQRALISQQISILSHNLIPISNNYNFIYLITNQIIFIILMSSANRALNLKQLNYCLLIAQISLINLGFFTHKTIQVELTIYQIVNSLLVFTAISVILNSSNQLTTVVSRKLKHSNLLEVNSLYFSILLFLWIGIPGTATFFSEFNIVLNLAQENIWLTILTGLGFLMLAIAILHALQEHVFNQNSNFITYPSKISFTGHVVIILCITLNIASGIYPDYVLNNVIHPLTYYNFKPFLVTNI